MKQAASSSGCSESGALGPPRAANRSSGADRGTMTISASAAAAPAMTVGNGQVKANPPANSGLRSRASSFSNSSTPMRSTSALPPSAACSKAISRS